MKILLLSGEIIEFPSQRDEKDIFDHLANHLDVHPMQVKLIRPPDEEEKGEEKEDDEEKTTDITYWAFISPKPVVHLPDYGIVADLKKDLEESSEQVQRFQRMNWLSTCVNESILTYLLKLPKQYFKQLYRNPHPLVVDAILSEFAGLSTFLQDILIHELMRNPSDRVVDYLLARPGLIDLRAFYYNPNPHAIQYVYEAVCEMMSEENFNRQDVFTHLHHVLVHPSLEEAMMDEVFTKLVEVVGGQSMIERWVMMDIGRLMNINRFVCPKLLESNDNVTYSNLRFDALFLQAMHDRDYRTICDYIVEMCKDQTACEMRDNFQLIENVGRMASISDSDMVMDVLLSDRMQKALVVPDDQRTYHNTRKYVSGLFANPHPRAVEWAIANYETYYDKNEEALRSWIHHNPHPDAIKFSLSLLEKLPAKEGLFENTHNYNPSYVLGVLENEKMKGCLQWSDVCRMLSKTDEFLVTFE